MALELSATRGLIIQGEQSLEPDISTIASLIGDTARARMLTALMGGKALTATELALEADITPQTASSHLSKLVEGELLKVRKQGRHRYFQLHSAEVAQLLESLLNLSASRNGTDVATGPSDTRLRQARVCYDHLAGELAVALYDQLLESGHIHETGDDAELTESGRAFFEGMGFSPDKGRRPECRSCLDWSERRSHMAGKLGQWILDNLIEEGWAEQQLDSRVIRFSDVGLKRFRQRYALPASE